MSLAPSWMANPSMIKERPILFSGAMVRAILDGRRTQTRRMVKPTPDIVHGDIVARHTPKDMALGRLGEIIRCPYGQPGDRLWVRETWAQPAALDPGPTVYRADYPACVPAGFENIPPAEAITWKPSIHMPRALCRIRLEITGVRVEGLNDCSVRDAIAEGADPEFPDPLISQACPEDYVAGYRKLWDSINGTGAWAANPWVWVVEFRRV